MFIRRQPDTEKSVHVSEADEADESRDGMVAKREHILARNLISIVCKIALQIITLMMVI